MLIQRKVNLPGTGSFFYHQDMACVLYFVHVRSSGMLADMGHTLLVNLEKGGNENLGS
jgi:hypothetical protein